MKTSKDIIAWQKAYQLTLLVYKYTRDFPKNEEFGIKSQLRRAAASVVSNIAEGYKRTHCKDKVKFYNQGQSSLEEIKCQLLLSFDLHYLELEKFKETDQLADETGKVLYAWTESQK